MRRHVLLRGVLACAAAAVCPVSLAPPPGPAQPKKTVDHVKDLFDDYYQARERTRFFDADGDGKLSPEKERAVTACWQQALQRERAEIDADGDRLLSADEITAYRWRMFENLRPQREQAKSRPTTAPGE